MRSLMDAEVLKLRKRWMPYILLGILVALLVLVQGLKVVLHTVSRSAAESGQVTDGLPPEFWRDQMMEIERATALPQGLVAPFATFQFIGAVMLIILGGSLVGSEYTWGTVRTAIARGAPRSGYLGAKVLILMALLATGLVVTAVIGSIVAVIVDGLIGGASSWDFLDGAFVGKYLLSMARTFIATAPYALLGVAVAVLTRGPTAAIAIGLVYILLEGIAISLMRGISDVFRAMSELTIGYNASALVQLNNFTDAAGAGINTSVVAEAALWRPLAVLAAYAVAFVIAALWSFRRRDLTTG